MTNVVSYKNTSLRYSDTGNGKTIVLLHGYLESLETWNDFASDLAKHFRVVCIDLPGHGESGCVGNIHTMDMLADAAKFIIDGLEIEKCFLIGHSMGGYATLAFAEKYPENLFAFCLFHSNALADNDEKMVNRSREIGLIKQGKKEVIYNLHVPNTFAYENVVKFAEFIKIGKNIAKNTSDQGIVASLEGMKIRPDRRHVLENANVPVLFIIGKKDNFIPWQNMDDIVCLVKNHEALYLEQSGHMGFVEEKAASLQGVIKFVNNIN